MKTTFYYIFIIIALSVYLTAKPEFVLIRVAAGRETPGKLISSLSKWNESGVIEHVLFLDNGKAEKNNQIAKFNSIAILEFNNDTSYNSWINNLVPTLPKGLIIKHATVLVHGEISPRNSSKAIFVINEYTPKVAQEEYNKFAQAYLKPLYEAMQSTQNLVYFTNFIEDGPIGEANAYSILEYRDSAAFAAMPPMKLKIREKLNQTNSGYTSYDKVKDTLRVDGGGTFASYLDLAKQ